MAMHNIPLRVHKTRAQFKAEAETSEPSSRKDNHRYCNMTAEKPE
jgi:hypothetical protein